MIGRIKKAAITGIWIIVSMHIPQNLTAQIPESEILVLTERGGLHEDFVLAALDWLTLYAKHNQFKLTVINHTDDITEPFLAKYRVFIQLNYPPYSWTDTAMAAFEKYVELGRGGWIGFHHAALLGEFDGYRMWDWFSNFLGEIRFKNYIPETVSGMVSVEDNVHPVMQGVSSSFVIGNEEWYTFDKSPRLKVHVLASVDEASYEPVSNITMGDHPVVWVNENKKARNVYFLLGHHPDLFQSEDFKRMFGNGISWAAGK